MSVRKAWFSRSYRWVYLWLAVGALLSLLLLTNSVRDYRFVARLLATQQVRHQMRQGLTGLEQKLRNVPRGTISRRALLEEELQASGVKPLWIQFRRMNGPLLEQSGDASLHVFTEEEEADGFRSHEPVYRVVDVGGGSAVVEAFALYDASLADEPGTGERIPRSILAVELAVPLKAAEPAVLRMQKWNLFLNCSGALALLGAVLVAGINVRRYVKGRVLEQQVEIAREVQARLLPVGTGDFGVVRAATEYRPAEQVGGDFYDIFPLGERKVAMVIGDVSGKGLPAALLMGVIHGAVRTSGWMESRQDHETETARLNSLICEHAEGHRYATMFWCTFDRGEGQLRYINAGHAPPLLVRQTPAGAGVERLGDGEWPIERLVEPPVERLDKGGPVVGLLPGARFEQAHCAVASGDVLVLCSDGLLEATRSDGEEFGEARLQQLLVGHTKGTPEEIRGAVLSALLRFMGESRVQDDLTLIVAKFV